MLFQTQFAISVEEVWILFVYWDLDAIVLASSLKLDDPLASYECFRIEAFDDVTLQYLCL